MYDAGLCSTYFAVKDFDTTVEKAKKMKTEVLVPLQDIASGRFAVLKDRSSHSCLFIDVVYR